ncbi:MAG: CYTH domain-containing protein [Rhodospirillales bacterium]|nr:CYTH domain-containing protein [Rhodospirillales bacterium]
MAKEIERKFLVVDDSWRGGASAQRIRQGYICSSPECAVRVRLAGPRAFLTVKGGKSGSIRDEYEYAIPPDDADELLERLCARPLIEKTRYTLPASDGAEWIVDVFEGANAGLVVAEIELEHAQQQFTLPAWTGIEVTDEPRYLNANLSARPFASWTPAEQRHGQDPAAEERRDG